MNGVNFGPLGTPGNLPAQQRLVQYLTGGRLHPAVILSGPAGFERLTIAKSAAKWLLCRTKKTGGTFCGECVACRKIDREIHPDVLMVKEDGEDILKIDKIREACQQMSLSPIEGVARVCIVEDCHRMNSASANAFLKTLEEPGENRFFWLLTSQPGALLPTIVSRCLRFSLAPKGELVPLNATPEFLGRLENLDSMDGIRKLVGELDSKEKVVDFVHALQSHLRSQALQATDESALLDSLEPFDEAVALEGRLRSNANYGLMLEAFLVQNYLAEGKTRSA